jgi:DNA-damage-inducible protein J
MIPETTKRMAQSAMTVRLDSQMKMQFDSLCEQFGMSANTAINIFVNAVVRNKSIPFYIGLGNSQATAREMAQQAFDAMRSRAEASSEPEMTLDEINEEIRLARNERKTKARL